jgi:hypothetical protein
MVDKVERTVSEYAWLCIKRAHVQRPLFGTSELYDRCYRTATCCMPPPWCRGIKDAWSRRAGVAG